MGGLTGLDRLKTGKSGSPLGCSKDSRLRLICDPLMADTTTSLAADSRGCWCRRGWRSSPLDGSHRVAWIWRRETRS